MGPQITTSEYLHLLPWQEVVGKCITTTELVSETIITLKINRKQVKIAIPKMCQKKFATKPVERSLRVTP